MKRYISILLSLALCVTGLKAQGIEPFNKFNALIPSANSYQMVKYGGLTPSLFTGTVSHSLSVVTYSDPDFTFPIRACYNFGGYKPSMHSGYLGYGWNLNYGGVVTREVRGLPDEAGLSSGNESLGFYTTCRRHDIDKTRCFSLAAENPYNHPGTLLLDGYDETTPASQIYNPLTDTPIYTNSQLSSTHRFDAAADIFHFNFMNYSGDFMLQENGDGDVIVFNSSAPHGALDIDLEYMNSSHTFEVTITTEDAYRYIFGGEDNAVEYSASFDSSNGEIDPEVYLKTMASLYLRKIIAPNGRELCINYGLTRQVNVSGGVTYSGSLDAHLTGHNATLEWSEPAHKRTMFSFNYQTLPQTISVRETDGTQRIYIVFEYENRQSLESSVSSFAGNSSEYGTLYSNAAYDLVGNSDSEKRLKKVTLKNIDGDIVDCAEFEQTYSLTNVHKMFLSKMTSLREGKYSFSYNMPSNYPFPHTNTSGTDHWGYYNGAPTFYDLRDHLESTSANSNSNLYSQMIDNIKDPSLIYSSLGALQRITYPTGGYTVITYELHDASRRMNQTQYTEPYFDTAFHQNFPVGGVRVKKIDNYNYDGTRSSGKSYLYKESGTGEDSQFSSGVLLQMPRYRFDFSYRYYVGSGAYIDAARREYTQGTWNVLTYGNHIGYSVVQEIYDDGSCTKYEFANAGPLPYSDVYFISPDGEYYTVQVFMKSFMVCPEWADEDVNTYCRPTFVPMSKDRSSRRGKLLRAVSTDVSGAVIHEESHKYMEEEVSIQPYAANSLAAFTKSGYYCLDIHETESMEKGKDGVGIEKNTSYNEDGQIEYTETVNAEGDGNGIYYKYATSLSGPLGRKVVTDVAETSIFNGEEYLTSRYHYSYDSNNPSPASSVRYIFPRTTLCPSGNYLWNVVYGWEQEVTSCTYNSLLRPVRIEKSGGQYRKFIWDVAERNIIGTEDNGPAGTVTYDMKDLVGPEQITDKFGQRMSYGYDSHMRPSWTKNGRNILLSQYDYFLNNGEDETPNYVMTKNFRSESGISTTDIGYYDGLGRESQLVELNSFQNRHLVTPFVIDCFGRRDTVKYLPYLSISSEFDCDAQTNQQSFYEDRFGSDGDYAFSENEYDGTPFGELRSSTRPGRNVRLYDRRQVVNRVLDNDASDVLRLVYDPAERTVTVNGTYEGTGILKCVDIVNEDGNRSVVFSDAFGRTICERQASDIDTYYVYDQYGNAVMVISPQGSDMLLDGDVLEETGTFVSKYCFLYKYDDKGRCIRKKLPGVDVIEMRYDDRDRLEYFQDGNLRAAGQWRHNEYDAYDNVVKESVGHFNTNNEYAQDYTLSERTYDTETESSDAILLRTDMLLAVYVGNIIESGIPASLRDWSIAGVEYFHEDDYVDNLFLAYEDTNSGIGYFYIPTCLYESVQEVIYSDPTGAYAIVPYIQAVSPIAVLPTQTTSNDVLSFADVYFGSEPVAVSSMVGSSRNRLVHERLKILKPSDSDINEEFVERSYYYDVDGRVLQTVETDLLGGVVRTSMCYNLIGDVLHVSKRVSDENNLIFSEDTNCEYDSRGRLVSESVFINGSPTPETTVLYSYDELGHLSEMRCGNIETRMDYGIQGELKSRGTFMTEGESEEIIFDEDLRYDDALFVTPSFSGMITEMRLRRGTDEVETESFVYDSCGRLVNTYRRVNDIPVDSFTEKNMNYDRNGNILGLSRYKSGNVRDSLAFIQNGNKLSKMRRNGILSSEFHYDSNGNMTFDASRDLEISYNLLNLPMEAFDVSDDETLVEVVYLADGTKLATAVPGEDGLLYIGNAVFNRFSDGTYSFESTPFSMGRIEGNSNGTLRKVFYATDHLGSVRSVVANGNVTGTNDFYPFGMRREYPAQSAAPVTRYLYNGKESLISVSPDILDFDARYYNPAICRWTSIDPLAEKYYSMTPYNYCANSPVVFVDPEGEDIYTIDSSGNITHYEVSEADHKMSNGIDKLAELDCDVLIATNGNGILTGNEDYIQVNDPSILSSIAEGNNPSGNCSRRDMINIFKFAANTFNGQEWGLYYNKQSYEFTTQGKSSSVCTSLDSVCWKIHSHPNEPPTTKAEFNSMGFWAPDSAYNDRGDFIGCNRGELRVAGRMNNNVPDWRQYIEDYTATKGHPSKSMVYFPVSGRCYNINYYYKPNIVKL